MIKKILLAVLCFTGASAYGASLSGGDAANQAAANTVVDIVFAIDTSGSMSDEASAISGAISTALANMQCPNIDVWVNARLTGLRGTWNGTLFDETSESVLAGVGAAVTINHSEDNGPVVFDFATANATYYVDPTPASQAYAKAIVTIGDEGLQNGASVAQDDYDVGKAANDIAIANGVLVFSLLGNNPSTGASDIFQALAVGRATTLGGHTFNDTGGLFTTTTSATPFDEVLEQVFCAAGQVMPPPDNIPTLSEWGLFILAFMLMLASWVGVGRKKRN